MTERLDQKIDNLSERVSHFEGRFDHHLDIYARNGKELEAVKTNQSWLMKFFWLFATPMIAGIVYIALHID